MLLPSALSFADFTMTCANNFLIFGFSCASPVCHWFRLGGFPNEGIHLGGKVEKVLVSCF